MKDSVFELNKQTIPVVKQMAEQLPGGFVLYRENETQDILFVNQALLEIYGCSTTEEFKDLTGYSFLGMVHPDDRKAILDSINSQIAGNYGSYDHVEYRILTKQGDVRWIDDYGHFSYSEDYGDVFYVFLFDITEKVQALEAKSKFFFDMSHQLLTPMNAVSTFIKLALKHKDDPALLEDYLLQADSAANHMVERIDSLVEIHRQSFSSGGSNLPQASHDSMRILLADDNELNRLMLRTILEDAEFLVDAVDDGDKAVDMVSTHAPGYYDAVLMDIQMPNMDGHEATSRIRVIPYAGKNMLPIIAVSANSRDEDIEKSMECGMNDHLAKPYDPDRIIEAICRHTGRRIT